MVRIEGPDLPYSTRYYRGGVVQFESSVGPLEVHEVEGDENVSLEYMTPSEDGSARDGARRKLGGGSLFHAMMGYEENQNLV